MHGSDILPRRRVFTVRGSFGNASGRYFARNEAHRLLGVRFEGASFKGHPFAVRECASKMLRPGFFGCAGEQKIIIAVPLPRQSATSVPWGSGRYSAAELQAPDVAIDANGDGAGGA